jgi:hypothetical protein
MRPTRVALVLALVLGLAACVPADEAVALGSVSFHFGASKLTTDGIPADLVVDEWALTFERVVVGYKTMTIGEIGVPDTCAYRGRGEVTNLVVEPRHGLVQTFNGLKPIDCPDVGLIFGPPDGATVLGDGIRAADLFELATGSPAHAIIDVTARQELPSDTKRVEQTLRIQLRFATDVTSMRFGGCREALRGVRIVANERDEVNVRFAAENLFRDAISSSSHLRVGPFVDADRNGNNDGIVTMDELEALALRRIPFEFYQLPDRGRNGSLADYVRELFRFTLTFRSEDGLCVGNEPGSE